MNVGYILYEIFELLHRGFLKYIHTILTGKVNVLDAVISLIWIILLCLWIVLMAENHEYQASESNDIMKAYSFLWGLQIIILTFRAIGLFSTSRSLGILVKAIKLMAVPIVKLLFIYALGMAGIIFGLWAILVINKCAYNPEDPECEDFQAATVLQTMVYVFQVFRFLFVQVDPNITQLNYFTRSS